MIEPWQVALGVQALIVAAAWGDLRRQVSSNQKVQDARHDENRAALTEISRDVKRINGQVARHDAEISNLRK